MRQFFGIRKLALMSVLFVLSSCGNSSVPSSNNSLPVGWDAQVRIGRVVFSELTEIAPLGQRRTSVVPENIKQVILKQNLVGQQQVSMGDINYLLYLQINGQAPTQDVKVQLEGQNKKGWTLFSSSEKPRSWWPVRFDNGVGSEAATFQFDYGGQKGKITTKIPDNKPKDLPWIENATLTEKTLYIKWKKVSFAKSYNVIVMRAGANRVEASGETVLLNLVVGPETNSIYFQAPPELNNGYLSGSSLQNYVAVVANEWDQKQNPELWHDSSQGANATVAVGLLQGELDAAASMNDVSPRILGGETGTLLTTQVDLRNMEGASDLLYNVASADPAVTIQDPAGGRLGGGQRVSMTVQVKCQVAGPHLTTVQVKLLNDPGRKGYEVPLQYQCFDAMKVKKLFTTALSVQAISSLNDNITLLQPNGKILVYQGFDFAGPVEHQGPAALQGKEWSMGVSGDGRYSTALVSLGQYEIHDNMEQITRNFSTQIPYAAPMLSNSGKHFVSVIVDNTSYTELYAFDTRFIRSLPGVFVAWSPSGNHFLLRGNSGYYLIQDVSTGKTVDTGISTSARLNWVDDLHVMGIEVDHKRQAHVLFRMDVNGLKEEILDRDGKFVGLDWIMAYDPEQRYVVAVDDFFDQIKLQSLDFSYRKTLLQLEDACSYQERRLVWMQQVPVLADRCNDQWNFYAVVK